MPDGPWASASSTASQSTLIWGNFSATHPTLGAFGHVEVGQAGQRDLPGPAVLIAGALWARQELGRAATPAHEGHTGTLPLIRPGRPGSPVRLPERRDTVPHTACRCPVVLHAREGAGVALIIPRIFR